MCGPRENVCAYCGSTGGLRADHSSSALDPYAETQRLRTELAAMTERVQQAEADVADLKRRNRIGAAHIGRQQRDLLELRAENARLRREKEADDEPERQT